MTNAISYFINTISSQTAPITRSGAPLGRDSTPAVSRSREAALMSACTGSFVFPSPTQSLRPPLSPKEGSCITHFEAAALISSCTGSFVAPTSACPEHPGSSERESSSPDEKKLDLQVLSPNY